MNPFTDLSRTLTRRHFFGRLSTGVGAVALASLLDPKGAAARTRPFAAPHFAPRAKRVIYLFMSGGPSHIDTLDCKPKLKELNGQPIPESLVAKQRRAFPSTFRLLGSPHRFERHGKSGVYLSATLPHTASIVDELTVVNSMHTEQFNHDPAVTFLNTGAALPGRPCMGSWLTYGLGTENRDLPGFVVLLSGGGQPIQARYWANGFLPSAYQGVQFRSQGDPVLFVSNPKGMAPEVRRQSIDAINALNRIQHETVGDPEIVARIEAFELAYRMQTSVPDLMDISKEPASIHESYGTEPGKTSFANNCLLARRLVERGVRFVQLYHMGWDHHGISANRDCDTGIKLLCKETDQPAAALVRDLKQRGLLDETLVIWGGEFGRTPMREARAGGKYLGRDHHPRAFSIWMAGGGIRPGTVYGKTDAFGYNVAENPVSAHDLQATVLHCLGLDHERLTYKFQGRNFRLTDIYGKIVTDLLA